MAAHDAAVASSDAQRFAASHTLSHTLISSVVLTARPAITLACPGRPSEDGGYLHSALPGVLVLGRGHTKPQMEPDAIAPIAANAEARLLGSSVLGGLVGRSLTLVLRLGRGFPAPRHQAACVDHIVAFAAARCIDPVRGGRIMLAAVNA